MTQKVYKDGDPCPKCGGFLYEGITPGKIVCDPSIEFLPRWTNERDMLFRFLSSWSFPDKHYLRSFTSLYSWESV